MRLARPCRYAIVSGASVAAGLCWGGVASATPTETVLYGFTGGADGAHPAGGWQTAHYMARPKVVGFSARAVSFLVAAWCSNLLPRPAERPYGLRPYFILLQAAMTERSHPQA